VSLTLLEQLSLPGNPAKPNEDSFAHLDHAALVLDGATPLGPPLLPGSSDAAWIAQFGARRLAAHLKDGDPPDRALKHALQDAEKSFAGLSRQPIRERWQTPCASMILASHTGPKMEFRWFGDCAALIEQDGRIEIVGDTIKKRGEEAARAHKAALEKNLSTIMDVNRSEIVPLLRAARNHINSGSNWLFAPDARAAAHVAKKTVTVKPGARLLLASDGFLALVSDYGAYDARGLMEAAANKGLTALGEELRALEKSDEDGRKFPRFKASDDATALLLQLI
jgi:hypothetical protein